MSSIISFNNVTVSFQGNPSVSDISFDVKPDELTVLVGRSGSGKSTLLRAVNKLNDCFDGCTTQGNIVVRIGGEAVEITSPKIDPNFLRSRVGMVFQTPNVLPVSIERNLLLPQKLVRGTSDYNARKNMERVLDEVGLLEEVKDRLPAAATTLSGGQQQRLCLARALALDPEILLLDEPTASVDHKSSKLIEELLLRMAPTLPMLVVSHSLAQTRSLADHVFLMRQGSIVGSWNRSNDSEAALDNLLYTTF